MEADTRPSTLPSPLPRADRLPSPSPTTIFARPLGAIQWMCPDCGCQHGSTRVNIRHGGLKCSRCHRKFRMGLGLGRDSTLGQAPVGKLSDPTHHNHIGPHPALVSTYARMRGAIEWQCPLCRKVDPLSQAPDWGTGLIICPACHGPSYIYIIIYPSPPTRLKTPRDWVRPLSFI